MSAERANNPGLGIFFIILAMVAVSFNDVIIKLMSGDYPLHQLVFTRSAIGIWIMLVVVWYEGGLGILRTDKPMLHFIRAFMLVLANLFYFVALAQMSLAEASAIFFVSPLIITLLGVPILGERVGPLRVGAIIVGFIGVIIMTKPWESASLREIPIWVYLLPIAAAATYGMNQVMTRLLSEAKASAMAIYVQLTFIGFSALIWLTVGDGRYAEGLEDESLQFLLRAWVWPEGDDVWYHLALGVNSALVGYAFTQAYRQATASTIAPFEYSGLPMAIILGWVFFDHLPGPLIYLGTALIIGAGLFVYFRERRKIG